MSIQTIFLPDRSPLLPQAANWLSARFGQGTSLDLSRVVCVLPTDYATSRFAVKLKESAADFLTYQPPHIIKIGQLASRLCDPSVSIASEMEQLLAWVQVLRQISAERLRPLLPTMDEHAGLDAWLEVASILNRLHAELAAARVKYVQVVEQVEAESDRVRWQILSELSVDYLRVLAESDLSDPSDACEQSIERGLSTFENTVVLIGTSDLSPLLNDLLRSSKCERIAMISGDASQSHMFNEHGGLNVSSWRNHELVFSESELVTADDIQDQSLAVVELLSQIQSRYSPEVTTIGVTDESQVAPIEIELTNREIPCHRNLGYRLIDTPAGRLITLLKDYLRHQTWSSLAALVRHSDVYEFVAARLNDRSVKSLKPSGFIAELDGLLANHFPVALDKSLPPIAASQFPVAVLIEQSIAAWMNSLVFEKTQPLSSWFLRLQKWLAELPVYKIHEVTPDSKRDRTQTAYAILMQLLQRLAKMNERLDTYGTIVEAIEVLLDRIRETRVRQPEGPNQIEILGWLDLALDDAPALIVVGLNHPFVPQAVTNDPFLPGGLRTRLGVMDNDRRLTRDVYALHLMLRSRTFKRFIFGKYSADGSPTPPSRLLAMTSPEDCARHVRTVLDSRRVTTTLKHPWDEIRRDAPLKRPPVDPAKRVASLSVTSLKDYLACPYRFYLRHVENLKPIDDSESELAANQFGDLIHMCMELFGLSPQKNETSAKRIEEQLIEHLSTHTSKFFGPATSRAVTLQIEQAKRRLAMVAVRQAEWVAEGWHIHQVEATVSDTLGAKITVDDQSIGLRGRLDRIDYHPATGRWTILDYKTHGHTPETQHLKRRGNGRFEWIDLQLPLYRRMIPFLGLDVDPNDVQLGYFNISGKEEETKINIAEFTPDQLAEADNLIIECARRILAGNFEPNPEGVQYDDYPMIVVSK